ncbi:Endonuclease IV [Malonomonas rubra DSM 5091]|uniref:Probable endonuclease 4 n=1 Tax=Malonomonas rubra DSM 5091 TaxID=1122189 RepID=A0A1M6FGE0_MALRU|nr:deoxyribonuclease IV [Malonomonas rubra]SHI96719.1 Endonuclease IV [Malonomonas rubra DSM 5091]
MGAPPLLIGAHVSIAGGIEKAFARGEAVGCTAIQVFTRNASRWQAKPLTEKSIVAFHDARQESNIGYVAAHDSYLINLASPDPELRNKSIAAFIDEMERCSQLGIEDLVMHPGAHVGAGPESGMNTLIESFHRIFSQAPDDVRVLVENTAGQGTCLGARFEELAEILDRLPSHKLAICFDTCHAFTAGYDLTSAEVYAETMDRFDRLIGCDKIALFHANDSKKPLGSRVDRHDHVGRGLIGPDGFAALMQDWRFTAVAKIIETPPGEDHCDDFANLAFLRRLANGEEV